MIKRLQPLLIFLLVALAEPAFPEAAKPSALFNNGQVFDGVSAKRLENASVLVEGNLIKQVSGSAIDAPGATVIDGGGRTLMPGLIDAAGTR